MPWSRDSPRERLSDKDIAGLMSYRIWLSEEGAIVAYRISSGWSSEPLPCILPPIPGILCARQTCYPALKIANTA